ncbi:MAG: integration host factor subunit beta [Paludibacteraceae bacterium]|nr:integration host factor subunit beta [Paludibacteraceae bacterium]MBP5456838.1 integration host factor subunit beta [Paludibacteraceae bacterium]MBR4839338.1 integration host factor subunit beta [Paludibacteraceae bacterium]
MTKAELTSKVAKSTGLDPQDVLQVIEGIMETIKGSLAKGDNVYLRGFGTFQLKKRAEKTARNISKNTAVIVPEHNIPFFKPCEEFKDDVSGLKK